MNQIYFVFLYDWILKKNVFLYDWILKKNVFLYALLSIIWCN